MMLTKDVHGELGNSTRQTQMQQRRRRLYRLSTRKRPDELVVTALLYDVLNFRIRGLDVCLFVSSKHPPVRRENAEVTESLVLSSINLCDFASVTQSPTLLQPRPRR